MLGLFLMLEYTLLVLFALVFGLRRIAACYLYSRGMLGSEHIEHKMIESLWYHVSLRFLLAQGIGGLVMGLAGIPALLYLAPHLREPVPIGSLALYLDYLEMTVVLGASVMLAGAILMFINSYMLKLGFRIVLVGSLLLLPITLLTAPLR